MPSRPEDAAPNPGDPPERNVTTLDLVVNAKDGVTTLRIIVKRQLSEPLIKQPQGDTHDRANKIQVWHEEHDGQVVTIIEATGERAQAPVQYLAGHEEFFSDLLSHVIDVTLGEVARKPEKHKNGVKSTHHVPNESEAVLALSELVENVRNLYHG